MTKYKCILMDPPWLERGGGRIKRGADRHYPLLKSDDINAIAFDVLHRQINHNNCHLWVWVTNNYLPDGINLIKHLHFRYITNIVWVKMRDGKLQKGLGQYTRGSHELLLFATSGKAMVPPPERRPPTVLFAERTKHSSKPDKSFELIETISPGPRLEMFARDNRNGWDRWSEEQ